jgi:hypothetical protein
MVGIGWGLLALGGIALFAGVALMARGSGAFGVRTRTRTRDAEPGTGGKFEFPFKDLIALMGSFGKVLTDPAATPEQKMLSSGAFLVVVGVLILALAVVLLIFGAVAIGH